MQPDEPRPEDLPPHLRQLREQLVRQNAANVAAEAGTKKISEPAGRWFLLTVGLLAGCAAGAFFALENLPLPLDPSSELWIPVGAVAFGLGMPVMILSLIFARYARLRLRLGRERTQTATGIVTDCQLERSPGSQGGGWVYRLVVMYQFESMGKTVTAAYRPSNAFHNMMSRHERNKKNYPPGQMTKLYYDPEQPENAGPVQPTPFGYLVWMSLFVLGCAATAGGGVALFRFVAGQMQ